MRANFTLSLLLFTFAAAAAAAGDSNTVATIGGAAVVTSEQLDRAVATKMLSVRVREYEIRRAALDEILDEKLIARRAEQLGLTTDQLLWREVTSRTPEVTVEQLETAYATAKGRVKELPPDEGHRMLRDLMTAQRARERRGEYLQELRRQMNARVLLEAPRVEVEAGGAPAEGRTDAPVTIVQFTDFQCPYCRTEAETLHSILIRYRDSVRIVYRHFPLPIHPDAPKAAEAAGCAAEQGKFREYTQLLYANQKELSVPDLKKYAATAKLEVDAFSSCLDSGRQAATLKADAAAAKALSVSATPTLFINGRPAYGALSFNALARIVDEELDRVTASRATAGGGR